MTFPVVQATNTGAVDGGAASTHTCNLPASIAAGDLLLIFMSGTASPGTVSATGWTFLSTDGTTNFLTIGWKLATGSEGASVSISTTVNTKASFNSYRISGWDGVTAPERGTAATGSSTSGDPPNCAPAAGVAKDFLWIAIVGVNSNTVPSGAPTNYSNLITNGGAGGSGISIGTARRTLNASSENPGVFTNANAAWTAQTVAITPVPVPPVKSPLKTYLRR